MSFVSRDYKPRRSPPSSGPRKIPVLRILLFAGILAFGLFHRHQVEKTVRELVPVVITWWNEMTTKEKPVVAPILGRNESLAIAGGKVFHLPKGSVQESWRIHDARSLATVLDFYSDSRIQSLIRTMVKADQPKLRAGVLDLIFRDTSEGQLPLFARYSDSIKVQSILRMPLNPVGEDYHYFNLATHCIWLESCPDDPLAGGVVPIPLDFDFGGREYLLTHDLFRGIGETPVVAVLSGKVRDVRTDSSKGTLVEIQHANNQVSRSLGLASLAEGVHVGSRVEQGQAIGRLSARDTVELVFQMLRNGQFVRWENFLRESRPVEPAVISTFQKELQL